MKIHIEYQGFCVSDYPFLNPFLKYFSLSLFITPLITIFGVKFIQNTDNTLGRVQAYIPFILKLIAFGIASYITQERRPFPDECLLDFQTRYGMPAPELVWFLSAWWLPLLYGPLWCGSIFLTYSAYFGIVLWMAIVPTIVLMSGAYTLHQFIFSHLFSLLTIPLFYFCVYWHRHKSIQSGTV